jgi:hypothetical protein
VIHTPKRRRGPWARLPRSVRILFLAAAVMLLALLAGRLIWGSVPGWIVIVLFWISLSVATVALRGRPRRDDAGD